ncbi:hypothetical protein EXIGLDRAFT_718421 [Exidia glandulosa HHB12029]|uniref:F-box domain-containing protein n=1 Tax=Exidia glandulosa HHB12029 TaxID=1314781 RepID=A0A165HQT3_EXIGL|nr:hypothetical protein EXIGLDRAFT_718421 [Exidia glandulosa HHB12029]
MSSLPVELYTEIARYLDRSDLAALSASTQTLHALATPLLYRHIAFSNYASLEHFFSPFRHIAFREPSVGQLFSLLQTLGDCAADVARFVQHLELDWAGDNDKPTPIMSMLNSDLRRMSGLTYLFVNRLERFDCLFEDVTLPALRECHITHWGTLDRGFLARHPHLKRLSLAAWYSHPGPLRPPMPQGLECLRMSNARYALDLLKGLPHGKDAKLARIDLSVTGRRREQGVWSEILRLVQNSFPTLSQVNIVGGWYAMRIFQHARPTFGYATRACVSCCNPLESVSLSEVEVRDMFISVAPAYPSVRTLDLLSGIGGFGLSYRDIARLVQETDGFGHVELIIFEDGTAYSRNGNGDFELLPTRMDDYLQFPWKNL